MRVKCPNCGSTAQITLTWEDTDVYGTIHTREYKCGCGCTFEINYIATKPKILNEEIVNTPNKK